jgi:transcriptional regulator with XRE-family HTH domain
MPSGNFNLTPSNLKVTNRHTMWKHERAEQLRKSEGRTKEWLAEYCGIKVDALNHYLAGRRKPRRPIIILIAQALNSTEEYLTGDEVSAHRHSARSA